MARIDWAVACDLAFFDRQDRLCIIGVVRRFPAPHLPLAISQLMLVARLAEIRPVEEIQLSIAVVTPSGLWAAPASADSLVIEIVGEYVLATLREIPLREEGVYAFQMALFGQPVVSIDIPVLALQDAVVADVH